jgi:hypothetical protein
MAATSSATVAVGAPTLSIVASQLDITLWPFAVTFFFAVVALGAYEDSMPIKKAFWNVLASTGIGGAVSQIVSLPFLFWISVKNPELTPWAALAQIPMTLIIAIAIGLIAHKAVPKLLELIGGFRSNQS